MRIFIYLVLLLNCSGLFAFTSTPAPKASEEAAFSCNLDAPTGLAVTNVTTSSIAINWNAVSGATGYFVKFTEIATGNIVYSATVATTNATAAGLSSGTAYEFTVAPVCSGGAVSTNYSRGEATTDFIIIDDFVASLEGSFNITGTYLFPPSNVIKLKVTDGTVHSFFKMEIHAGQIQAANELHVRHDNFITRGDQWLFVNEITSCPIENTYYVHASEVKVFYGSGANPEEVVGNSDNWVMTFVPTRQGNQLQIRIADIKSGYSVIWDESVSGSNGGRPDGVDDREMTVGENSAVPAMRISPNPFEDVLSVELPQNSGEQQPQNIQLFDLQGKVVYEQRVENGANLLQISTAQLASGLYMVRLETNDQVVIRKVVKK